jgi:hypothetical protein
MASLAVCPKDPRVQLMHEGRPPALATGCFFSFPVMLLVGVELTNALGFNHLIPMPAYVSALVLTGGVPAAFCALAFMTYKDTKLKTSILGLPTYRQPNPRDHIVRGVIHEISQPNPIATGSAPQA